MIAMDLRTLAQAVDHDAYSTTTIFLAKERVYIHDDRNPLHAEIHLGVEEVIVYLRDDQGADQAEARFAGAVSADAIAAFVLALLG